MRHTANRLPATLLPALLLVAACANAGPQPEPVDFVVNAPYRQPIFASTGPDGALRWRVRTTDGQTLFCTHPTVESCADAATRHRDMLEALD